MELTTRELWTAIHGMALGAAFLLLFSGGAFALLSLGARGMNREAANSLLRKMSVGSWLMTLLVWLTVLVGTYSVYPWYRAKPPAGQALTNYPKYLLLANPKTADWHEFGMEWKEHIAWLSPILMTVISIAVTWHGQLLVSDRSFRRMVLVLFTVAFFSASVAGLFGALLNKAAPIR